MSTQHPAKYILDEKELSRVSALARIEIEDARVELERASKLAATMGRGLDEDDSDGNGEWEELSLFDFGVHSIDTDYF